MGNRPRPRIERGPQFQYIWQFLLLSNKNIYCTTITSYSIVVQVGMLICEDHKIDSLWAPLELLFICLDILFSIAGYTLLILFA